MSATAWALMLLAVITVALVPQLVRAQGLRRGLPLALIICGACGLTWAWLAAPHPTDGAPADWAAIESVSSASCAKCHAGHYESWHRTYHRTMTRDAAPDTVKGDFNNAVYEFQGTSTQFLREGDAFFMRTVDRDWAMMRAKLGESDPRVGPPQYRKMRVDRTIGSHWVQEYLHKEPDGTFTRLPVLYHIAEKKWVHNHGAFLAPESPDFWAKCRGFTWNDTCLYCHNTGPVKNPKRGPRGEHHGYDTQVAELGISCEACHGPAADHVRLNQNPARRYDLQHSAAGDPSIVNPTRLTVQRRDEICARCHGALWPKIQTWDLKTHKDPFIPGQELERFNHIFWSEAQQHELARKPKPDREDGRFWGDGTPLTTALEYNGMALSACYQQGKGAMSCLSCHTLHGDDPNYLLKPRMNTNDACLQCHAEYRDRLAEHSRHAADSAGSQCVSCHMPHQVFSLFTTHRSHRVQIPAVKDSIGTGKPHACNLCHLDKSLGWTQEQLMKWPNGASRSVTLSEDEQQVSLALLMLTTGDARTRAVVAAAFEKPAARKASGTDWFAPFLTRLMADERYPMVRHLLHRGVQAAHDPSDSYDYMAKPAARAAQLKSLQSRWDAPVKRPLPHLPLKPDGMPDDAILKRLLNQRRDPDVTINE